ncbi:nitrite/sulfite reductase [Sulfurivermis fontis]|uniref:nitrite/sulfite reductase n=1 Tax=Sulfurivermis fontis TaxID=1972068 RepID=UPI000FDB2FAE|nr:nitrite/sulfite reductase [Sulfurivermis fontis]
MIDQAVLDRYQSDVTDFLAGILDAERFAARRLHQGIYAQLQDGYYMLRTKLPAGRLQAQQLIGVAEVVENYCQEGHKVIHLTTRQDIQFHFLRLEDTPAVLRHLARYGITSREASGNTVRNITACPLAGVCPREHTDVNRHVGAAARHFLGHPLTQQLPRKFKIGFSGCGADCALGAINDVALIATLRDGRGGFRLYGFGGLGAKPYAAVEIDPFVPEEHVLPAIEAVLSLHHRHSERSNRSRARIKFLRDRFDLEQLRAMYREELRRCLLQPHMLPAGEWREGSGEVPCRQGVVRGVVAQRQAGLYAVPVSVRLGQLCNRQLRGLAELLAALELPELRTTLNQNLLIPDVPQETRAALQEGLARFGLGVPQSGDDVVNCPGAALCPLAITTSQPLAARIHGGVCDLRIRVNGCQNSCAQSDTADIGLYGVARRHHGTLLPSYVLQLGGSGVVDGAFAGAGPVVPARRVPDAVRRLHDAYSAGRLPAEDFGAYVRRVGPAYFDALLADLTAVEPQDIPLLARDLGVTASFRSGQRGIGECAGSRTDPLLLLDAELVYQRNSRNAFLQEGNFAEARACVAAALRATLAAVEDLPASNGALDDPARHGALLRRRFPQRPEFAVALEAIHADHGDDIAAWVRQADDWIARVRAALVEVRRLPPASVTVS